MSWMHGQEQSGRWGRWAGVIALSAALALASSGRAQEDSDEDDLESAGKKSASEAAEDEDERENVPPRKVDPSSLKLEAGAPRPGAQTPAIAPPAPPPGTPPPPPTVKVGGGVILAYFHPYGIEKDARRLGIPVRKPYMEVFRAALFLDSKIGRFGVHLEFRARDKRLRNYSEGTAWMEEAYGSFDLIKPETDNPIVLKVGKAYRQFGRFWDDSFYGNIHLRDGLKLDANYGVSLEGELGKTKLFTTKFYAQYFVIDGGTNTSLDGRDTFSNPAPESGYPMGSYAVSRARRRNEFTVRVEPGLMFDRLKGKFLKVGASFSNFTADFGPTVDQQDVKRFEADITANFLWFGAWAEYTLQKGRSVTDFPYPAGVTMTPAGNLPRPPRSSDDVAYLHAGGRFLWNGIMLRYNFSSGEYKNIQLPLPAAISAMVPAGSLPEVTVKETMHVPGIMISATQQLFLMIEAPIQKRHITAYSLPRALGGTTPPQDYILDKQIVVTLHGRL
jgi:hypothetical protein